MKTIFITGATGYLGGYFLYHLLQHTNDKIICLGRDKGMFSAKGRIHKKLQNIHASYCNTGINNFNLIDKMRNNLKIVSGDITKENLGIKNGLKKSNISECWHIAADVRFLESKREQIMNTNVNGGKNILKFIQQNNIPILNFVSTAYVAGKKTGNISEDMADENFAVNNAYEESKRIIEKEIVAASFGGEFSYRIFRPGIIVGHSVTFDPDDSNGGLYGFLYLCASISEQLNDINSVYLKSKTVKLQANVNTSLSLTCVDDVVNMMFSIGNKPGSIKQIYHVISSSDVPLIRIAHFVSNLFGVQIELVSSDKDFTLFDRLFNRHVNHYKPYLFYTKNFERNKFRNNIKDDQFLLDDNKLCKLIEKFYRQFQKRKVGNEVTTSAASLQTISYPQQQKHLMIQNYFSLGY